MQRYYYVYILASKSQTLYVGVTNNLQNRVYKHKKGQGSKFTSKYNITKLVYYEVFGDIRYAIEREKQLKGYRRSKKIELIERENSEWNDISLDWFL